MTFNTDGLLKTLATPRPTINDLVRSAEAEVAAKVIAAIRADLHPGHMGHHSYEHVQACLDHVAEQFGVQP